MGRAFRVVKRMAHLTVEVAERPVKVGTAPARTGETKGRRTTKAPKTTKTAKTAGAAR
jgi:hypothetical protein